MILADKIIRLRKQLGWSQEELAEKMSVSRQSVSKWESANSVPDLNKILMLADIFEVSTDFLLKDEHENFETDTNTQQPNVNQISIEQANQYVAQKAELAHITTKGVILCVCSVIPLFFFLALTQVGTLGITNDIAAILGIFGLLIMVSMGVGQLIKTNQFDTELAPIEDEKFELAYGVYSIFSEKLKAFRPSYNRKVSIAVFLFISSFMPLMVSLSIGGNSTTALLMLIVMFLIIATGLFIIIPSSTEHDAYNNILNDDDGTSEKSRREKRARKLAAFYWPLATAIYLGWSLWTMAWGVTWIVWPVAGVLFAAAIGFMELTVKEDG